MNRFTGGIFVLPLLGTTVYTLIAWGAPWRGEWHGTVDAMTGSTVLTAPLVAAFAAHVALAQSRMVELTGSTARGALVPYRSALQAWAWGGAVYAASAVVALAITAAGPHGGPFSVWALLIGAQVLAVGALAGAVAVHVWPHRMVVVLIGPLVFLVGAFGPSPYADLIRQGPTGGSLAGLEYDPGVWWMQVAGLMGVLGILAVALLPRERASWRPLTVAVCVASVAVLVATGLVFDQHEPERLRPSAEKPVACRGHDPQVCLAPSDSRFLKRVESAMQPAFSALTAIGAVLPNRYEQLLPGYHPPVDRGMIADIEDAAGSIRAQGARYVVTPAGCPAWTAHTGPPPPQAYYAQDLIVDWLLRDGGGAPNRWPEAGQRWLRGADTPAARAWIVSTLARLRHCELDQIRLPWPTTARE